MKAATVLAGKGTMWRCEASASSGGWGTLIRSGAYTSAVAWSPRQEALAGDNVGASAGSDGGMNWADAKGGGCDEIRVC